MDRPTESRFPVDLLAALLAGLGYLLLATSTLLATAEGRGVAAVWPANALLLAVLLSLPARRWPIYFATGFAANMTSNLIGHGGLAAAQFYAAINMAEVAIAAGLMRVERPGSNPFEDVRAVLRFLVAAGLIAPLLSALGGATVAHHLFGQPWWSAYCNWYATNALGLLIFTPLLHGTISGEVARGIEGMGVGRRIEAAAILIFVALVAILTFFVAGYPMLFMLMAPVMLATFRLGQFGAKISLIIAAAISVSATLHGYGPIAAMIADRGQQALFVQFYLATMLLSTLPVSAELNARRSLAHRLAASEASVRLLASGSADALVRLDRQGRCVQSSGATAMLLGIDSKALIGKPFATLIEHRDRESLRSAYQDALAQPGAVTYCEFRMEGGAGHWLECTLRALVGQNGRVDGAIAAIRNITTRKERELSLSRAASIDGLTGTLNHAAFMAHLDRALAPANISKLALLMIDIDHFKRINDGFGHPAGDKVLMELCAQLRSLIRGSDVIGRLGGDEIGIILHGATEELALTIAEALRGEVHARPIFVREDIAQTVSISCGVAQASPGISRAELLRKADDALYEAKSGGRGRVVSAP